MSGSTPPRPEGGSFIKARIQSFGYAIAGVGTLIREQQNAWIHLLLTVIVVIFGLWFSIAATEWALITVAIVLVWMAEALNTAVEILCDLVSVEYHPLIKKAKDIAAGAVLVTAVGAAIIGVIVFLPYLQR